MPTALETTDNNPRQTSAYSLSISIDAGASFWGRTRFVVWGVLLWDATIGPFELFYSLRELGINAPIKLYSGCYPAARIADVVVEAQMPASYSGNTISLGTQV
jgi:hypothetical protein